MDASDNLAPTVGALADFTNHRIEGFATHGGQFSVPLFSQIEGNLWMGGCPVNTLPKEFMYAFNLYGVGYSIHQHQTLVVRCLHDSLGQKLVREELLALAHMVKKAMSVGPTLVHCQAGLNRSGLITALVLMLHGFSDEQAVALLREKRCSEVLCNSAFRKWLNDENARMRGAVVDRTKAQPDASRSTGWTA